MAGGEEYIARSAGLPGLKLVEAYRVRNGLYVKPPEPICGV